ncbi:hypothetical protein [Natrinema longum]|uniref:Uncharacterized protein n=1 Tax=Natrinema longum TaxID=370324 RepID=A0A8A2UCB3_9EURY|nr:hypothetical protein [Natrinema longum]MBZ6495695.1 hypothetical protein [Natrinema longum]QSW86346.1 hypothetical protein J0X27_05875 [Natrinema longum]
MSNPSTVSNESIAPSDPETELLREYADRIRRSLKGPAQFLSFWIAIALPFIHLPLLSQGLGDPTVTLTFVVLLAVNVLALYAGHGYNN